jgi:DNA-binding XRE family transcriptional regulator
MARTLDEVIRSLPLDQQQDIEARAARLIEEEMTLRDLRKAQELTQARVAEALHISQDGVSRIESEATSCSRRYDPTSRRWVAACASWWNSPTAIL